MIQAIIFDFDGTILETESLDFLCWQEMYQAHQCELPVDLWLNAVGGSAAEFDPHAHLEKLIGRTLDRLSLREKRRARMNELVTQECIRPGVVETIAVAQQMGLRLGVASSSGREWVEGYLTQFDLRRHFEVLFTCEDVVRVKPDPALYVLAVNALGVLATDAVAIEDSRNGMLAAKAAGLNCLVVPNAVTKQLLFPEADLQMSSLLDRPLQEWIEELQVAGQVSR